MKKAIKRLVAAGLIATALSGCTYSSIALTPDNRLIVARNTFAGFDRNIYICDVTDTGVTDCIKSEEKP